MQRSLWKSVWCEVMLNTSRRHIRPTRQSSSVAQACRSDKTRMESVQTYQLCLGKFLEFSYCQELMSWYTQKTMPPTSFQKLLFQQYSLRLPFTGIEKVHVVFGPVILSNYFSEYVYDSAFLESSEVISFVIFVGLNLVILLSTPSAGMWPTSSSLEAKKSLEIDTLTFRLETFSDLCLV